MRRTKALSCLFAGAAHARFLQLRSLRQSAAGQGTLAALADHMATTRTVHKAKAALHAFVAVDTYAQPMFHGKLGYESIARIYLLQVSLAYSVPVCLVLVTHHVTMTVMNAHLCFYGCRRHVPMTAVTTSPVRECLVLLYCSGSCALRSQES